MQEREIFSSLSIFPPFVVRLDGRAFHRFTRDMGFEKPFDRRFSDAMALVSEQLLSSSGMEPSFAFTFSDEISLFFPRVPFGGRVEKIDSVCASYAASALTLILGLTEPVAFDSRVILADVSATIAYLTMRQREAWRNHINGYCQQTLIAEGMSATQAARSLRGMKGPAMHEMMFERGVNLAKTPAWERRGIACYRTEVIKEGYNPVTKETVTATRRVVITDDDLPLFSDTDGEAFLRAHLGYPE
ncbi:tRNA(His) guanylyltransferase Thg1 family protein [Methanogenium organophilum]|uniref:tRNA 5'-guanylyltransferase n=1 Tax=Methanogenium organophilum TaxID=2199 RepID=A0A9X9S5L5_METOG|nr:tRNA(His) guanylyltransferase Thg1 family protein [Methanogenium organophilum]WAI02101.1 tRNA 5'-guanylyltransferase [Methanogenium organophilum]